MKINFQYIAEKVFILFVIALVHNWVNHSFFDFHYTYTHSFIAAVFIYIGQAAGSFFYENLNQYFAKN